jgi:hypothetical protein
VAGSYSLSLGGTGGSFSNLYLNVSPPFPIFAVSLTVCVILQSLPRARAPTRSSKIPEVAFSSILSYNYVVPFCFDRVCTQDNRRRSAVASHAGPSGHGESIESSGVHLRNSMISLVRHGSD